MHWLWMLLREHPTSFLDVKQMFKSVLLHADLSFNVAETQFNENGGTAIVRVIRRNGASQTVDVIP